MRIYMGGKLMNYEALIAEDDLHYSLMMATNWNLKYKLANMSSKVFTILIRFFFPLSQKLMVTTPRK